MTEDQWLVLFTVLIVIVAIYELCTGNLTRWSERGVVKNVTKYCNIVGGRMGEFTSEEFSSRNRPPYDAYKKKSLTLSELRGLLLAISSDVARAVIDINPVSAYLIDNGGIVIVYKYNRIIFKLPEKE